MNSLPNSFFQQEPVVFFSSAPPAQDFEGHRHGPRSHHRGCDDGPSFGQRRGNHDPSFSFLKPLAMSILSLFALSMLIRTALFLVAVMFSPPVLLLCLFVVLLSQTGNHNQYWNHHGFQQCFRNPRRFRRFFPTTNWNRCGRGYANRRSSGRWDAPASGRPSSSTRPASSSSPASATTSSRQGPASAEARDTADGHDGFELISPFNLMMAAAAAGEGTSRSDNTGINEADSSRSQNTKEESEKVSPTSRLPSQLQKVPVHRHETKEALTIAMDISGFDIANIHITVANDALCISGERTNKIGDTFMVEERFDLDKEQFDEDSVKASASDGVLEVTVQKKAAPQPRVISIRTDDDKEE